MMLPKEQNPQMAATRVDSVHQDDFTAISYAVTHGLLTIPPCVGWNEISPEWVVMHEADGNLAHSHSGCCMPAAGRTAHRCHLGQPVGLELTVSRAAMTSGGIPAISGVGKAWMEGGDDHSSFNLSSTLDVKDQRYWLDWVPKSADEAIKTTSCLPSQCSNRRVRFEMEGSPNSMTRAVHPTVSLTNGSGDSGNEPTKEQMTKLHDLVFSTVEDATERGLAFTIGQNGMVTKEEYLTLVDDELVFHYDRHDLAYEHGSSKASRKGWRTRDIEQRTTALWTKMTQFAKSQGGDASEDAISMIEARSTVRQSSEWDLNRGCSWR